MIAVGPTAYLALVSNLGSFLFGFDFGAVSWVLTIIERYFSDPVEEYAFFGYIDEHTYLEGLIGALASIGAACTYVLLLFFANRFSKRDEIILAAVLYFIGALLESSSGEFSWESYEGLLILSLGRVIYGAGFATTFHSVPQYVAQACPSEARGMIGASTEAMVSTGVVVGYLVGYFNNTSTGFIVIFRVGYIIAFMMGFFALFLPQSPSYLIRMKRSHEEILESIQFVLPFADAEDVRALEMQAEEEEKERMKWILKWRKEDALVTDMNLAGNVVTNFPMELRLLLSDKNLHNCLALAVVLVTLQMATGQAAILYYVGSIFDQLCTHPDECIVGIGVAKIAGAYAMLFVGDSLGRRTFLCGGLTVVIGGMFMLVVGLAADSYTAAVIGIYTSVVGYEMSLGSLLWILLSELFPEIVRPAANSISVCVLFLWSTIITFYLPQMKKDIGLGGTFAVFLSASAVALQIIYLYVPETRGFDIEESYKQVKVNCDQVNRYFGCPTNPADSDDEGAEEREPLGEKNYLVREAI
jgi:MFS family permease